MKFVAAALATLLTVLALPAATFTLAWDPPVGGDPATGYRIKSLTPTTTNELATTSATTQAITLLDGAYTLAVSATNLVGESALSAPLMVVVNGTNVVAISRLPGRPLNLQLR